MPDMPVAASDFDVDTTALTIDSLDAAHAHDRHVHSRVLDAGDAHVTGLSVTPTDAQPAGTSIQYDTRTAAAEADLAAAPWTPLAGGGAVANPKRYVEYRATLTTSNLDATPALDKVGRRVRGRRRGARRHDPGRHGLRPRRQGHVRLG